MRSEPSLNRDAPAGQLAEIDLVNVAAKMAVPINLDWYGQLVSNNPSKLPLQLTEPSTDEGNHLSYAIQWIMFAIMAFGFLAWVIRREFEFARSQNDPNYVAPKQRNSQARLDAQAEDAED
jgi:cytochrome oxidase assembly protein ShyY1